MKELDILINSLRIIASPYEVQKSYYPNYVSLADEIANELECLDWNKDKLIQEGKLSSEILDRIADIDRGFLSISYGEKDYSPALWDDLSIKKDKFWQIQRDKANDVLKDLGVGYSLPVKYEL